MDKNVLKIYERNLQSCVMKIKFMKVLHVSWLLNEWRHHVPDIIIKATSIAAIKRDVEKPETVNCSDIFLQIELKVTGIICDNYVTNVLIFTKLLTLLQEIEKRTIIKNFLEFYIDVNVKHHEIFIM